MTALRRLKVQSMRLRAAVLLAGVIAFAAHLAVTLARLDGLDSAVLLVDAGLALLLLLAVYAHLGGLVRERQQHVMSTLLLELTMEPQRIHDSAGRALALLAEAGLAEAGVVAIARGSEWLPVAAYAFPDDWIDDAPTLQREPVTAASRLRDPATHPWAAAIVPALGSRATVMLVPVGVDEEPIGLLLLAARRPGALRNRSALTLTGRALGAALQHAEIYEAATERERALEAQSLRHREVLGRLAHEVRTPLAAIAELAALIPSDGSARGERGRLLTALALAVERLEQMVNELLRQDGEETAALHASPELVDVTQAIRVAEAVLRPAFMLGEQTLTLALPPGPAHAFADRDHVEQVVLNLLSNANRRTPMGGHVRVRLTTPDDRTTLIEVEDSGAPVSGAAREQLFEIDGQTSALDGEPALNVARHLTRLQGGQIWAEPHPSGTRFSVSLPGPAAARARRGS